MTKALIYGPGGFDASKPNNNLLRVIDNIDDLTPEPVYATDEQAAAAEEG